MVELSKLFNFIVQNQFEVQFFEQIFIDLLAEKFKILAKDFMGQIKFIVFFFVF